MMSFAKITAGSGYLYLVRHTALGDAGPAGQRDAAAYYTEQGNLPGQWGGRGAPLLGVAGREVTEKQMRALFGVGAHPDMDAITAAYVDEHWRPWMTGERLERLAADAVRHATLGRQFPVRRQLAPFDQRVAARLEAIRAEAGREPTEAETGRAQALEARRPRDAIAGYDLVFSPVKSAALLWAVDPRPHVQAAIRAAHLAAKDAALDLLEEHAAFTRTGAGGAAQITARGLVTAEFEHWDSRAGDPNLHTHVAVSAKVMGADGAWRALDARPLHAGAVAASETYNTVFELELTSRLGVTFTPRPGTGSGKEPVREITGVPVAMTAHFSRRRAAIEARYADLEHGYRAAHGHDPDPGTARKLARQANLETREQKKPAASLEGKRAAWRAELAARFGAGALSLLTAAVPASPPARAGTERTASSADLENLAGQALDALSARRPAWTMWNARAEAERRIRASLPGLPPAAHRATADALTATILARSVLIEAPALLDEPASLRRPGGESVFTVHGAARYTSQAVLDAENRLVGAARTPVAGGLSGPLAAAALDGFEARHGTRLDPGQRHLVTAFATHPRLLLAGIGPAGAGKTTAMRALAHVLRHGGRNLIPLATSAAAAEVLGHELGTRAENLHKFLWEWDRGPFAGQLRAGAGVPAPARMYRAGPGDIIVVDEAGMAGTLQLDRLVRIAAARGAMVRLLGDDRQIPAVGPGGALRLLAAEPAAPRLTALYRFSDPAEAAATLQLRAGDPAAVDFYHQHGRIRSGSRQAMTQAAYDGWKADMLAGKITLMAAQAGTDVTALAARARADRVAAGQVEPDGAPLRDGTQAGEGDWIVTRLNSRRLTAPGGEWVRNGDAWTVTRRHPGGALTVTSTTHGGRVTLPAAYVREHVQLLYATTAHRAQGATVDTAHPLITVGMTRESLYVLATRARNATTLYVATHDQPAGEDARTDASRHDPGHHEARETLHAILASESASRTATETIAAAQDQAGSLAALMPAYLHAARKYATTHGSPHGTPGSGTATGGSQNPGASRAVLPWMPPPPAATNGSPLAAYLRHAAELIATRASRLADAAITDRAPWLTALGAPPADPERHAAWTACATIIAAYRDQHHVTTTDPRHPLGPHPDPDHPSHHAHQLATRAARAARDLAAPQPPETQPGDPETAGRPRHPRPQPSQHSSRQELPQAPAPAACPAARPLTAHRPGEPGASRHARGPVL